MLDDMLQTAIIISILASMLRIATPILLAALGELVTERSGVLNLGVEGMMLMSAFTAFMVTYFSGSIWLGVLAAAITGGLMAFLMVFMAATLRVEQIVTGMALNLFGAGVSLFWHRLLFDKTQANVATIEIFRPLHIPVLSDLPYIGEVLFSHRWMTFFAFLMVPVIWFFLYRTKYGLQIRSAGENPRAIDTKGVSVIRLRYFATIFGGIMAGLGGSVLTLGASPRFIPNITAGVGWLAIVAVIAGNWRPWRVMVAALAFALLDSFQFHLQGVGVQFPHQILLALPYVFAIIAMMGSRARSEAPSALGLPYFRE
jgi:simple sugar transport system permease protein